MKNLLLYANTILILMSPIQVVIPPDSTETTIRVGGGNAHYVSSIESMIIGYGPSGCGFYPSPRYSHELEVDTVKDFSIEIDRRPASSPSHFGIRAHGFRTTNTGALSLAVNLYFGIADKYAAFNGGFIISGNRLIGVGRKAMPTIALRLGPPGFHLSYSYLSGVPLVSNGISQLGLGVKPFGDGLNVWVGMSNVYFKGVGFLAKANFWTTPNLGLQAAFRKGSYRIGKEHANENSVSLGITFKLPK